MKRLFFIAISGLTLLSCAKEEIIIRDKFYVDEILSKADIKEDSYAVADEDVKNYLHFKQLENPKLKLKNIEPFECEGHTLLYVLNFNEGWEVISGDKRTQVVLAKGEEGDFTMKDYEKTPWGTWVYTLAMDVLSMKRENPHLDYKENADYDFWGHIGGPLYLPPRDSTFNNFIDGPLILEPSPLYGHYVLSQVEYVYDVDTVLVNRLTTTNWRQSEYSIAGNSRAGNNYVLLNKYRDQHVPSGCTAVAGAQLAYYLHYKIGKPIHCPVYNNECTHYTQRSDRQYYNPSFVPDDFRTDLWDLMDNSYNVYHEDEDFSNTNYSDMLIAYIGRKANMKYGENGSRASLEDLQSGFFEYNSIWCTYYDYFDTNIVRSELCDSTRKVPVIVAAYTAPRRTPGRSGHTFLIDGCKYSRKKPIYTYEWEWYERYLNGNISNFIPIVEPLVEEGECEYQRVEFFQMNWGWEAWRNKYCVYAPTGNWNSYNCDKEMLVGFHIHNN